MKALRTGLIALAVAVAGVALAKNLVAKAAVMGGVKAMTGLNLKIRQMDVGVFKSAIGIHGLLLENPSGFPEQVMLDLPDIYVDYDLGAFLQRRVHLEEVRLDLKEFTVIKDQQGRLNLDALNVVSESKAPSVEHKPAERAPEIQIDALQLKIGKVVYKDYAGGGAPNVQEFPVNIDERYEHITNPQALAALIVSRAMMNTAVAKLTGLKLTAIQSQMGAQLQQAAQVMAETAKQLSAAAVQLQGAAAGMTDGAKAAAEGVTGAGKEALGTAAGAVKDTSKALKKLLPFGQ